MMGRRLFLFVFLALAAVSCDRQMETDDIISSYLSRISGQPDAPGAIFLDGEAYSVFSSSGFWGGGPSFYAPDAPVTRHASLFGPSDKTFYKIWGNVQITAGQGSEVSTIWVYIPDISPDGIEYNVKTEICYAVDAMQNRTFSDIVKSVTVRKFSLGQDYLKVLLSIEFKDGRTAVIVYSGPSKRMWVA